MVLLNNLRSPVLDSLELRYIVVPQSVDLGANTPNGRIVFAADGCNVWQIPTRGNLRVSGAAFYPAGKGAATIPKPFDLAPLFRC